MREGDVREIRYLRNANVDIFCLEGVWRNVLGLSFTGLTSDTTTKTVVD